MLMAHGDDPSVRARERAFGHAEGVADELMAFFLRGMTPPKDSLTVRIPDKYAGA